MLRTLPSRLATSGRNSWTTCAIRPRCPARIATLTRRECLPGPNALECRRWLWCRQVPDAGNLPDEQAVVAEDELLTAERHAALREAFRDLPLSCQRLLALLIADPPMSYAEISARLGIPIGSIGAWPQTAAWNGCRKRPALAALISAEAAAS